MSSQPSSEAFDFQSFLLRLQSGEADAVHKLFDDYSQKLVRLAGANIHPALLKRFDGEDIVQSVFRSFCRRQGEGRFQIEHSQQLWQLLVTLTLCKTRSHARKHTADRRDATADLAVSDINQMFGQTPSSLDALAFWEEIDVVLDGLPEQAATIIAMRLEGYGGSEIAKQIGISRQSVHRILKLARERIEKRMKFYSAQTKN